MSNFHHIRQHGTVIYQNYTLHVACEAQQYTVDSHYLNHVH